MINIEGLTYKYPSNEGLEKIRLSIKEGEKVALIGQSGAGKSTLLKCINCLLYPSQGKIEINGENIVNCSEKKAQRLRRKIGMIFQDYNLIQRSLTIYNVLLGRLGYLPFWKKYLIGFSYSNKDYKIALNSLKQVGMESFTYRRVDNLSGGQMQRVGIARALTQKPKIILADEPVSNLDPRRKQEIMDLLSSICTKFNLTLIVSMHEVSLVKRYVSRVVGIKEGRITFDGNKSELTEREYERIYF